MKKEFTTLLDEVFVFLKREDFFLFEKLFDPIEEKYPDFYEFVKKYHNNKLWHKISESLGSLPAGGAPFLLLGEKKEREEKYKKFLVDRAILKNKIELFMEQEELSEKEKDFLNYIYIHF